MKPNCERCGSENIQMGSDRSIFCNEENCKHIEIRKNPLYILRDIEELK